MVRSIITGLKYVCIISCLIISSVEEPLGNLSGGSFELAHKLTSCVNCVKVSYPVLPMQTFAVAHTKDSSALPLVARLSWDSDIRLTQGL